MAQAEELFKDCSSDYFVPIENPFAKAVHATRVLLTKPHWPAALYLVRHGQAEHNDEQAEAQGKIWEKSSQEIGLTPKGVRQAQETGQALAKHKKFDVIIYSPSDRAKLTAEAIVQHWVMRYSSKRKLPSGKRNWENYG